MKKDERLWLDAVASHGCIVCNNMGIEDSPCEIHHLRHGAGTGQRSSHFHTIGLCHSHHRTGGHGTALHAGIKAFENKHGTELDLYHQTLALMGADDAQTREN